MKKYLWLNPVIYEQYLESSLQEFAEKNNFSLVHPKRNFASSVKEKVKKIVESSNKTVIDTRCPMAVEVLRKLHPTLHFAKVEPILIHIARELSDSQEFKDGEKWIVTPCQALVHQGKELKLKNTKFLTWLDLLEEYPFSLLPNFPKSSPIPPGFFSTIPVKQISLTGEELYLPFSKDIQLVEALYCPLGCHNGDGVEHEK